MKTQEQVHEIVSRLNGIDDTMFHKIVEDRKACQEMLQTFQEDPGLRLIRTEAQRYLRNVGTRSVIIDALCEDEREKLYGIEMQKRDEDDHQRRVRYVSSNLDTSVTEKGIDFAEIPEVQMIYLSRFDVFGMGQTVYRVNRVLDNLGREVDNGYRETYINAKIDDGSRIAELMQYLKNTKGSNEQFPHLSARVRYLREEGAVEMCKLVEDYAERRVREALREAERKAKEAAKEAAKENAKENARNLFINGVSLELVSSSVKNLTRDETLAIYDEVMGVNA